MLTKIRKHLIGITLPLAVLMTLLLPAAPVSAQLDNTITVTPAAIVKDPVTAGQTKVYDITISTGIPLDVEVVGLGISIEGAPFAATTAQDTSPFSCRTWITLDKSAIGPGGNQNVKATLKIPADATPGERYAGIWVHTHIDSDTTIVSGVLVPVIIVVNQPAFTPIITGRIDSVEVVNAYAGKSVMVNTVVTDTGNAMMTDARLTVVIKNSAGQNVFEETRDIPQPSLIPNYPRRLHTAWDASALGTGTFTVTSTLRLDDGTQIGTPAVKDFSLTQAPAVPAKPALIGPGSDTAPGATVNTLTPTMQWSAVTGAEAYNLVIKADPYGANNVVYEYPGLTGTSFIIPQGKLFNGGKYRWELSAVNAGGASETASLYFQTQGTTLPAVSATGITSLGSTQATLNANLTSRGSDASVNVSFEYGLSTGAMTSTTPAVAKSTTGGFNATITGLAPNTVYYYRAKAQGSGAAVYSTPLSFLTPPAPTTTPPPASTTVPPVTTIPNSPTSYSGFFPPAIDSSSLSLAEAAKLDNIAKAGVEVDASSAGASKVITGRYTSDPQVSVAFSSGLVNGGMGKSAIKFAGVRVEGAVSGNARVTFHYADADIKNFEPTSLFLAYFSDGSWRRATGITISPASRTVSADIPLVRLSGTAIGLGGTEIKSSSVVIPGGVIPGGNGGQTNAQGTAVPWALVGIATAGIFIIGIIAVVIVTGRRRHEHQYYQPRNPYDAE